jgi:hypothetical protein
MHRVGSIGQGARSKGQRARSKTGHAGEKGQGQATHYSISVLELW